MLNKPLEAPPNPHPIEQEIQRLGLDKNRVMQWIQKASHSIAKTFNDLNPNQTKKLLAQLPKWAEQH